jgi:Tfp pilus assembly protein PilF
MESVSAGLLQRVIDRLSGLSSCTPHPGLPKRLIALFRDLSVPNPPRETFETEDMIWALWCEHPEQDAAQKMELAIRAMAAKRLDASEAYLTDLVAHYPEWAEAWNKRATVYFIRGDDSSALVDIAQTIDLEPRHFGALSGLGMICERQNEPEAAIFAYRCALHVHPQLEPIQHRMATLLASTATPN